MKMMVMALVGMMVLVVMAMIKMIFMVMMMIVSLQELERERQAHSVLKVHFKETEDTLRQTKELLTVRHPHSQDRQQEDMGDTQNRKNQGF